MPLFFTTQVLEVEACSWGVRDVAEFTRRKSITMDAAVNVDKPSDASERVEVPDGSRGGSHDSDDDKHNDDANKKEELQL